MTTLTLWLLISLGSDRKPTTIVERFPTVIECQRVARIIHESNYWASVKCVQADVVVVLK